jgi:hypothetical protein
VFFAQANLRILVGYVYVAQFNDGQTPQRLPVNSRLMRSGQFEKFTAAHDAFLKWSLQPSSDSSVGILLAQQRLDVLRSLSLIDPDFASELRLPQRVRSLLSADVLRFVEEPIDTTAIFSHIIADSDITSEEFDHVTFPGKPEGTLPEGDSRFRSFANKDRRVPVWGYMLDQRIAVLGSYAVRQAESEEFPNVPLAADEYLVVVAGSPLILNSEIDAVQLATDIAGSYTEDSLASGKKRSIATANVGSGNTVRSVKYMLFVNCLFSDVPGYPVPWKNDTAADLVEAAQRFQNYTSIGTNGAIAALNTSFFDCFISQNFMYLGYRELRDICKNQAVSAGIQLAAVDHFVLYIPQEVELSDFSGSTRGSSSAASTGRCVDI